MSVGNDVIALPVKRTNQIFQYLKAIAILMVIDDHMSTRIGILSSIFPYNSFYMPMLVFISGYFYKKRGAFYNIKKKLKSLFLPYLSWTLAGNLIAYILKQCGIVDWYWGINRWTIWSLVSITPPPAVGAMWFVIMLLWVSVLYNILRRMLVRDTQLVDYALLTISVLAGVVSLKLCIAGYCSNQLYLPFLRVGFYFQFFHMGVMFKRYWERYIQNIRTLYLCTFCMLVNVILLCFFGNRINFYSTCWMSEFRSCWLPLVTSISGTLFWYKLVQFISSKVGSIKIVDFIANNTFCIMASHLIFINIPNFYVYYQILRGSDAFPDFDVELFRCSPWVRYSPNTRLVGFFCGVIGSLALACAIQIIKNFLIKNARLMSQR